MNSRFSSYNSAVTLGSISFSAGVMVLCLFGELPRIWPLFCAAAIFSLAGIRFKTVFPLACAATGLCWATLNAGNLLSQTIPESIENRDVQVTGRVYGIPQKAPGFTKFDFLVEETNWDSGVHTPPRLIRLKLYDAFQGIHSGQKWIFTVRLKRSRGYQNPGSLFDYEAYLFANRIRATGYVRWEGQNHLIEQTGSLLSISRFRERTSNFIARRFAENPGQGILSALVVGIRTTMSDDQWQTLRRTGTNHLVAISGLHVGLVSGIIIWLVSQLWRLTGQLQNWIPARNAGIVGGIAAAVIYAFLAGMTVPTRRALIMLSIFGVAVLCRKKATSSEVLSLALFAVLLFDPLSPLSSGFWLSFGAVLAIVSWIGRTAKGPSRQKPVESVIKYVKGWTSVQLAVCIGLLPILLFGFGQASLISPIANMIAIPIVGILAVPLGLLGLFVFTLGFEEHATHCFAMAIYVLNFLFVVLEYLADLPWAILETEAISMIQMFLLIMVVLFLFLPSAMPARATLILWLLPVLLESQQARDSESFRYTMLEVGQGLASVIETDQHVLVYDTGPKSRSGFDSGQSIVVPYLQNQGIKKLDALVVSHNHNDHKGGYESLVARYPADRQWFGNPGNLPDIEPCVAGHKWKWDGVDFEFLWPPADANLDGNNTSCVLLVRSRFGALLLTGDIESEVEQVLTEKYGPRLKSDVIQVPHQGSKTSSTTAFLKHVNPDLALVSAGYLNRFSHPHLVVQRRYHGIGAIQYNTAVNGAVSVDFSSPISVRLQRETATKYWRQPSRPAFYQE